VEIFIDIKSFRSHYGPGVDSAFNRNDYQEYFLGVKAAGALPPSCALVTKSGNLNVLEPSGPLQTCNGTDLTLYNIGIETGVFNCQDSKQPSLYFASVQKRHSSEIRTLSRPHDHCSRRSSVARVESLIKLRECERNTKTNGTALNFRSLLVQGGATKDKTNINLNVLFIA